MSQASQEYVQAQMQLLEEKWQKKLEEALAIKDEEIRRLAMEQKARKAAASGHDVVRQGMLIHI